MTFKWPSKDPDETVDFSMDWSRYLNDQATIDNVTWFVDNASGVKTELANVLICPMCKNVEEIEPDETKED